MTYNALYFLHPAQIGGEGRLEVIKASSDKISSRESVDSSNWDVSFYSSIEQPIVINRVKINAKEKKL